MVNRGLSGRRVSEERGCVGVDVMVNGYDQSGEDGLRIIRVGFGLGSAFRQQQQPSSKQ